jgi:hypothetical protein
MLQSRRRLIRTATLAAPALLGVVLIAALIPTIGSFLSVETRLANQMDRLFFDTDCDGLLASIWVDPNPGVETDFSSSTSGLKVPVELNVDPTVTFEECSYLVLELTPSEGSPPTVIDHLGGPIRVVSDPSTVPVLIELSLFEETRILLDWPSAVRYSHEGVGLLNRVVGPRSAVLSMFVDWAHRRETNKGLQLSLDFTVVAPELYWPSYASDYNRQERTEAIVSWSNSDEDPKRDGRSLLAPTAKSRTDDYEAKTNLVLISGGATIGLGLTLIVESLIAVLFRLEKVLIARSRRRPAPVSGSNSAEGEAKEEEETSPEAEPDNDEPGEGLAEEAPAETEETGGAS